MGCGCNKNKKFPLKKSSRMPMKKKSCTRSSNVVQENQMTPNDRRAKIIKFQNAKKIKQIRREQFEWERRTNNENI